MPVPDPLLAEDYEALAVFRYGMRRFLAFSKGVLRSDAELTPEQYEVLLALKAFPAVAGLTIGDLSERLQVKHNTAVSLVGKLVARGLVEREAGISDRRKVFVRLSPEGDRLLAKVAVVHRAELRARSAELIRALSRLAE